VGRSTAQTVAQVYSLLTRQSKARLKAAWRKAAMPMRGDKVRYLGVELKGSSFLPDCDICGRPDGSRARTLRRGPEGREAWR
jgi:hypothetical protein